MKKKGKDYKCVFCGYVGKADSTICPKCRHILAPVTEQNKKLSIITAAR